MVNHKTYKGKFTPNNPKKYNGDYNSITWRSTWELKYMKWLDNEPSVISWSSEEIVVPYISPIDNKVHRYFVDFFMKIKSSDGTVKTYLVEIKPEKQSSPPNIKKRITKKYIEEVARWGVNRSKWTAAIEYAKDRKWEFVVVTSDDGINFKILTEKQLLLS